MSELTTIRFDGDNLQTVREGAQVWVVLKRACEALGLDPEPQRKKLAEKAWAVTSFMEATGTDGKSYEMLCLDLDSLPMWLATIEASRVRPEAREKLVHYQRECARVLRDHFFGRAHAAQAFDAAVLGAVIGQAVAQHVAPLAEAVVRLADRVTALEARHVANPFVHGYDATRVSKAVCALAKSMHEVGDAASVKAARTSIRQRMGAYVGWGGRCQSWSRMPAEKLPYVDAFLDGLRRDIEAKRARCMAPRQLTLVPPSNDNAAKG